MSVSDAIVEVKEILRFTATGRSLLKHPQVVWRSKHQSQRVEIAAADGFVPVPIWASSLLLLDKRDGVLRLIAGACAPSSSVADCAGKKLADVTWASQAHSKQHKALVDGIRALYSRDDVLETPRFATGDELPVHVYVRAVAEFTAPILHTAESAVAYERLVDSSLPLAWIRDPLSRACLAVLLPTFCCRYDTDCSARGTTAGDQWTMPTLTDEMGSVSLDCEDAALFTVAHWYSLLQHGSAQTKDVLERYTLFFIVGVILDDLTDGEYAHAYCLALPDDVKQPPLLLDGTMLMDGVFDAQLRPESLYRRELPISRDRMQQPIPAGGYAANYKTIYIAVDTGSFETYSFETPLPVAKFVDAFNNGSHVNGTHRIPCDDECATLTRQWAGKLGFGVIPAGSSCFFDCVADNACVVEPVTELSSNQTDDSDTRDWYICREADYCRCKGDDAADLRVERRCVLSRSRALSFVVASLRRSTSA